ncbi:hypothetical protein EUTSA_v10001915mg [Eutrema salsugineum]|uniref:Glycosyltransferase 2-like domain-containing protein n=1 Tax=Eutrema salsugineum TaxID=72664 RepID=V4MCN9_EUTSA|nr:cellulose synthase-like protein B3 isoform X2 [Eutrema salsugineum]ESQ50248.1 hypothetical protein EUTSA_v10001915mg [Eutrema salsugineum]
MADSSFSPLPLYERISYKSYVRRALNLTVLGFLFSLLLYRILYMNQNDIAWVMAFLYEFCFFFTWLLITNITWSPAEYKPYPDRLDERVHDLPSVDMFVPTADPVREPPLIVVNTVLSLLAVNYPANKLACYVSDDGCSPLTYFSLKEACKFAKIWVPFCKKYNVRVRAPFIYFLNPVVSSEDPEFTKDWEMTKMEYEKISQIVEDATGDSHWFDADDDFEAFSNTKPNDHSTIVKVIFENKGGVGDEKEVPHLVYISREKRPNYVHHYKAGALNFLVRVTGLMTNAPYMLNVDCDMYANEADVVRQAMCIFLQESMNPNHIAFVQHSANFRDSKADEFNIFPSYMERGVAGIQGAIYTGSGCFHTRKIMYGLTPDDLEDDGSLSSVATRKILTDDNLSKVFGHSIEMTKSVVSALRGKLNRQHSLTYSLEAAREVGNLHYEYQTSWGKTIGWLYDSVLEDVNTSIEIHSRGWTSSLISSDPPAFIGCTPPVGLEAMLRKRRCFTGGLEIIFNKQSPLIGMFHQKIEFRQRLAYLSISMMGLGFLPVLFYCLLPAYCLLNNSPLYPKGLRLGINFTLLGMPCFYTLRGFTSPDFSVQLWCANICGSLFSIFDITLKLLGISKTVFRITKKTMPDIKLGSKDRQSQQEDDGQSSEIDGLLYLPGTFILLVNLAALADYLVGLQLWSRSDERDGSALAEASGCTFVVMVFLPLLKSLFYDGKSGIPSSTLYKAAFLVVFFVIFSVEK